jgi:hypothetical protein
MFRPKVPAVTAAGAAVGTVPGGGAQVLSPLALRFTGALLALGVAVVHVADQGGITTFNSPDWLGWSFRLIEVGGVLTAVLLLLPWSGRLGWAAGALAGLGPFLGTWPPGPWACLAIRATSGTGGTGWARCR